MSEKLLTDSEAAALYGVENSVTGVKYPSVTVNNWGNNRNRCDERLIAIATLANNMRVFEVEDNADAVGVRAGRCIIDGVVYAYTEEDPAIDGLTNNDTTYIWAENDSGINIDSAIDGTGWPAGAHIKLAEVTMSGGVITGIVDRRPELILSNAANFKAATAVADLNQDISASYVEAEVQAMSDKVDELLAALRTAGLLAS